MKFQFIKIYRNMNIYYINIYIYMCIGDTYQQQIVETILNIPFARGNQYKMLIARNYPQRIYKYQMNSLVMICSHFRVILFQSRFDELWRRFEMYSNGEKLFGMEVKDYPILHQKKKEFNLLSKLFVFFFFVFKF